MITKHLRRDARRHHGIGFWATAFAFTIAMAFSAAPTPLYTIYQQRDGFSTFTITIIYAAYAVGVMVSLLLVGHLSDWIGRRRALVPALLLSVASVGLFLLWTTLPGLLVGRVLNGLSIGVVTATATAYLAELHAGHRPDAGPRRAEVVATAANLAGIGIGPLVAGLLAQYVPDPLVIPYVLFGALLLIGALVLLAMPETAHLPEVRPAYRPQRVAVPREDRGRYAAAALSGLVAFAALGVFNSVAPIFLAGTLGHRSHALAGVVAFLVFGAAAAGQTLLGARSPRIVLRAGQAALPVGLAIVTAAVWMQRPSLALFILGGVLTGAGAGLLFKAVLGMVVAMANPDRRAEALAGFFMASYIGLSLPVVGLGVAAETIGARSGLLILAAATLAAVAASGWALRERRTRRLQPVTQAG